MAILPTEQPVTPLRQRMLDDMAMRAMWLRTRHDYVRYVRAFVAFLGRSPDTAATEDVRRFHQRELGAGEPAINDTSQLPTASWHHTIGDSTYAVAMVLVTPARTTIAWQD